MSTGSGGVGVEKRELGDKEDVGECCGLKMGLLKSVCVCEVSLLFELIFDAVSRVDDNNARHFTNRKICAFSIKHYFKTVPPPLTTNTPIPPQKKKKEKKRRGNLRWPWALHKAGLYIRIGGSLPNRGEISAGISATNLTSLRSDIEHSGYI